MAQKIVVFWRDIPAQLLVKQGRKTARRQLSERFEKAVDMAAMRARLTGTDAYLAEWRRSDPAKMEGDLEQIAETAANELEQSYSRDRLRRLVDNLGFEPSD